ncbi:MAG: 3-phosphoshikimate 1-carboxyvinyltransferase [Xanthomonadales bacterium]|nr:3-phosphoshikimate 1-carboxyvinyltransferase [Xanthomonadales bacterium]
MDWRAGAGRAVSGRITVPGDKSISHRALMLAALADGETRIEGFLEGEDTRATAAILAAMGVAIQAPADAVRLVRGVGLHGLRAPAQALDCGNSGTAMRLLAGLLAGQDFDSVLTGDVSLSTRPMRRVVEPLTTMGARVAATPAGTAPLSIRGGQCLRGGDHVLPVASAQVKSALLLAGLRADGPVRMREPHATRDYTESMLRAFGVDIETDASGWISLQPPARLLSPGRIEVPADFSSAAFFLVAASVVPGSELAIECVGLNPRRTGLLDSLLDMGADIAIGNRREAGGETVADLHVRHAPLLGIDVPPARVPDMIDEFPALFAAAALAEGETRIAGAAELRVKESDRIAVMAAGLRVLGIAIEERPDGAVIRGGRPRGGVRLDSAGDHRCAMALAVLAQAAPAPVTIGDCANVATSFPGFVELAAAVGLELAPGQSFHARGDRLRR